MQIFKWPHHWFTNTSQDIEQKSSILYVLNEIHLRDWGRGVSHTSKYKQYNNIGQWVVRHLLSMSKLSVCAGPSSETEVIYFCNSILHHTILLFTVVYWVDWWIVRERLLHPDQNEANNNIVFWANQRGAWALFSLANQIIWHRGV